MKKIFLILCVLISATSFSQVGYTTINSRYNWLAGIFRALGFPSGANAAFQPGQAHVQGSVYMDTVNTEGSPNGFYIFEDPTGGNAPFWNLQGGQVSTLPDGLISGGKIVYSGTGLTFNIQPAVYRIGGILYGSPAGSFTLTAADATFNRQDVVYLATDDNFHVLEGTPATPASIPQVDGDQIALTSILIPFGSLTPGITTFVIYDENIEWALTDFGTTSDGNNATNVWIGAKSSNITNIDHGDYIEYKQPIGTTNISTFDALDMFIKLKMVVPTLSELWVSLWNGTAQLTTELKVAFDKNNITTYQGVSIPIAAFGTPASYEINKVRFRWRVTGANPNHTGFYLDYVHFVDGISSPGTGSVQSVGLSMPSAFLVTGSPVTSSGTLTVTGAGSTAQYIRGNGTLATFPTVLTTIGTLDGRAKSADGAVIDLPEFFQQTVDSVFPGLATPDMYTRVFTDYFIKNLGDPVTVDSLVIPVTANITGIKGFKDSTGIGFAVYPDYISIYATSGGTVTSASEGVSLTGTDVRLFGPLATPAQLTMERSINLRRQILHFNNSENSTISGGPEWNFTDRPFSPYQILSTDTLAANSIDPPTAAMPLSGIFARRTLFYNSGIFTTQKIYGHYLGQTINWLDSMRFRTEGGDYNVGTIIENRLAPRGTGAQRTGINGTGNNNLAYYGAPTLLSNTYLYSPAGAYIHTYGWLVGISSYLVTGHSAATDTVERFSFYQTNAFIQGTSHVKKAYQFDMQNYTSGARVDSSFGIWDQFGFRHYLRGKTVFGFGTNWATSDQVKVWGNVNISDSVHLGKASLIGDSTGMDWVLRRRTDGALFRINASDMAAFFTGGSSLFPITGTGTATGDVIGVVGTNSLTIDISAGGAFDIHNDDGVGDWSGDIIMSDQVIQLLTTSLLGDANINAGGGKLLFQSGANDYEFPDLIDDGAATKVVVYNTTSDKIGTVDLSSLGSTQGLDDVLAVNQALTADRTTPTSAFNWTIDGSNNVATLKVTNSGPGAAYAIIAEGSTDNGGVSGSSVDLYGGDFQSTNLTGLNAGSFNGYGAQIGSVNSIAAQFSVNPAAGNTIIPIAEFTRSTTGTGANGLGESFDFYLENAAGSSVKATQIITKYTDATNGSEDTEFEIWGMVAGVLTKFQTIGSGGVGGGGSGTVNTGTANTLAYYPASNTTVDDLAAITANRALISDANGLPIASAVTNTTLAFLDATSSVQTQLNAKANTALSNLASVAVNTSIVSDADNTDDLGSAANGWKDIYTRTVKYDGATSGTVTVQAQATGISPLVTTTTGQGYGCSCMEARETSDFTGQNINTVQPMFNTAIDVWPLTASTSYDFEIFLSLSHGATSHSVGVSFELSGGASVTSITYISMVWTTAINTQVASQTTNFVQQTTNTAINAAGANAVEQIWIRGTINMNAAGNVTPSYTYSSAPGTTVLTKAGSGIRFCPKGTNTFTNIGPAN